ncbi:Demethylmenaquinone methyltransferase [Anaerovirgula multivorans]|uniref:Demethylmenaquinone methyltransferase n=2 Tax=Anaerovirgula multivorans TaxID=312168 RepID=A0A239L6Y0_9FIRM|nr:Demethylmenaquinone methyltransferase [Anaerovirgula multivorans]
MCLGEINASVLCRGKIICQGDIILGDEDGIVIMKNYQKELE